MKLNIGSGPNRMEGYINVDVRSFDGSVDVVLNVGVDIFPWEDGSIEEVFCSHLVEHLNAQERIHFINECHRVLSPSGKIVMIVPHWASCRAYGDLTHQWPPVSEFWFYYLSKEWRNINAPHNDMYTCDLSAVWGYSANPAITTRNQEYQQFAMSNYKEAITDMHVTMTKNIPK